MYVVSSSTTTTTKEDGHKEPLLDTESALSDSLLIPIDLQISRFCSVAIMSPVCCVKCFKPSIKVTYLLAIVKVLIAVTLVVRVSTESFMSMEFIVGFFFLGLVALIVFIMRTTLLLSERIS